MLGNAKDNPDVLERAAQYLRNYEETKMKSDKAKPFSHVNMPSHKNNHPSKLGQSGTNENFNEKDHATDIEWGEGLNGLHPAHKLIKVKDAKVHKNGIQESRNHQARRENGGANPMGKLG